MYSRYRKNSNGQHSLFSEPQMDQQHYTKIGLCPSHTIKNACDSPVIKAGEDSINFIFN